MISIRRAVPSDAVRATEVARSAKAHWGYPTEWLEQWRDGLAIKEADIEAHPTYVAIDGEENVVGVCQVQGDSGRFMLEHVWVDPVAHGRGIGRALVEHAKGSVEGILHIVADPNAERFYLKLGAERVGEVEAPMPGAPGRKLPLLELHARS